MKPKRLFSIESIFPKFLTTEQDEEYYVQIKKEDILLNDTLYPNSETTIVHKEALKGIKLLRFYFIFVLLAFTILFWRTWFLQVTANKEFFSLAEGHRINTINVSATRGIVYDRNKNILVKNIPSFNVSIIPASLPTNKEEKEKVYAKLSELIKMSVEEIKKILIESNTPPITPVIIRKNLDRTTAFLIESNHIHLSGILITSEAIRSYAKAPSLGHILGYMSPITKEELQKNYKHNYNINDKTGKTGIEAYYESLLRGIPDTQKIEVNNLGMPVKLLKKANPTPGKNLFLTIDIQLQQKVGDILQKYIDKSGSSEKAGAAILQNPQNGEILAMVSLPDYNNNLFSVGISNADYQKLIDPKSKNPLINRAISGNYPPGSVFKQYVALAALQENNITANTKILDIGYFRIGNNTYSNWLWNSYKQTDGWINVKQALERSNDIFFYTIGGGYDEHSGIGSDKIALYAKLFGFDQKTEIDLLNESSGLIPSVSLYNKQNKFWGTGHTYLMAIGQGFVLTTPIQLVNSLSAIANNGTLYKPHILKEIVSFDGSDIKPFTPEILNHVFVNTQHLNTVKEGLLMVTNSSRGTAYNSFKNFPIKVAGKTGTAQYDNNTKNHAWFVAFAPYDNPEVCLVVLVEDGKEGSTTAAPAAREILDYYFHEYKKQLNAIPSQ